LEGLSICGKSDVTRDKLNEMPKTNRARLFIKGLGDFSKVVMWGIEIAVYFWKKIFKEA